MLIYRHMVILHYLGDVEEIFQLVNEAEMLNFFYTFQKHNWWYYSTYLMCCKFEYNKYSKIVGVLIWTFHTQILELKLQHNKCSHFFYSLCKISCFILSMLVTKMTVKKSCNMHSFCVTFCFFLSCVQNISLIT